MDALFEVHMLNEAGKRNAQYIAGAFNDLLDKLGQICPAGREMAITKTKLEEACFFAKKAMASDTSNQQ